VRSSPKPNDQSWDRFTGFLNLKIFSSQFFLSALSLPLPMSDAATRAAKLAEWKKSKATQVAKPPAKTSVPIEKAKVVYQFSTL
jgi:hypothetical protein